MAVIELKKFVWTDSRTLTEYSARTVAFSKANPDTDGVSDFSARYDHTHKAANLKYDDNFQCINLVNKTKLYALKSQTDMEVWVSNEIAKKTEQIEWKNAVNNYSELLNVAQPKDGWMVPVLQDQTISGTYYQSGDYRYHDNILHPTGQASGWYLINSTKVPNASATINGLMTSADFTKLASLSDVPNFGTGHDDVARGDHNHDAVYVKLTDARLTDARKASDVYAWAKATTKPAYAFSEITSKPTTLAGYGITDSVSTNDPRMTNARPASDVYAWAKSATPPKVGNSDFANVLQWRNPDGSFINDYGVIADRIVPDSGMTRLYLKVPEGEKLNMVNVYQADRAALSLDVPAWAKAASKPSYTASEVGAAASSHTHTSVVGVYTGGGGNFAPTYVGNEKVRFNMRMIPQLLGNQTYVDCLSMNCYTGGDVPFVTSMGVSKTSYPRGFIASAPVGNTSVDSWVYREIACIDNLPTLASLGGVSSTDSRLTDARKASDVYDWAKAANKPSYAFSEITSKPTTLAGYGISDGVLTSLKVGNTDNHGYFDMELASFNVARLVIGANAGFGNKTPAMSISYGVVNFPNTPTIAGKAILHTDNIAAWAKAASKPSYTASEVGAAASSHTHTSVVGVYIPGGGNFAPTYVGNEKVRFNMRMIPQLLGNQTYVDCLSMNCYTGGDVPFVTSMGVSKTSYPRGFIASAPVGNTSVDSWVYREIACIDNLPTLASLGGVSSTDSRLTDARKASDVYDWAKAATKPAYGFGEIVPKDFGLIPLNTVYRQPMLRSRVSGGYLSHIQLGVKRYSNENWGSGVLSVGINDAATSFIDYEFDIGGRIHSPAGQFALTSELPTLESLNGIPKTASCYRNWNWSGQNGQPTWLWGGNDATNQYLYNPSNFNVASATYSNNCNADLQMNSKWIRNCIDIAFASDIRLKKDFVPITQELTNGVLDIKPFQYEFKKEPGKKRVGYIAQDVQAVFPDMVSVNHNEDDEENPETLAFSYRELMILKLEALVEEVNNLKQEIADLKRNK